MKYVIFIISLFVITSCAKGETPAPAPEPTPAPTEVTTTEPNPATVIDGAPISEAPQTVSNPPTHDPYYDELRKRCSVEVEEKKAGCNASVEVMEKNNYIEADYDADGNRLPCPEGMQNNTIRSYGGLTWCEYPPK